MRKSYIPTTLIRELLVKEPLFSHIGRISECMTTDARTGKTILDINYLMNQVKDGRRLKQFKARFFTYIEDLQKYLIKRQKRIRVKANQAQDQLKTTRQAFNKESNPRIKDQFNFQLTVYQKRLQILTDQLKANAERQTSILPLMEELQRNHINFIKEHEKAKRQKEKQR